MEAEAGSGGTGNCHWGATEAVDVFVLDVAVPNQQLAILSQQIPELHDLEISVLPLEFVALWGRAASSDVTSQRQSTTWSAVSFAGVRNAEQAGSTCLGMPAR